ncbi:Peptidyl-prolyl cis-trans isomerase PpiD [Pseudomonas chlororaphis subsp. aurantiaca]|uniref:Periplasmic chaperone PpiD n=1 Tax=Pseudomonas chlororaphis subsp. aurantiaca TaxID=86192 RepID=A0AAJ0ZHW9_9PSED|nr:SurA N-terminal domain-containing protein [Pseudomonas chlororaphis]AIS12240.1 peptidylprolyl isomerase [Pseudomonas chlororaphis subsp. aurantiaca]AZD36853.1 Peptidyl-prolyl cis-trans isomerase PpiD [Pseudomonas chlororaphis subsp. aurantiaca]AZD43192.1 Peptidyl-prolyl cis-trans isomerase PpiD [Pseudomonas chlororaphis subsp. aurantiaca]AZD68188.1 Peptidyl-prolyl cis-trans isomerase PpiD [Pseudomonas chlororaphis subsp. aurantiaca]AZD80558.1 Peptidyl-prolyl cis-trans isomerase PpiD [Pseudo
MLQNIRDNSQGWIAKTIIGVIVALMALTGFDAIFQATSTSKDAAKVNGEEITQNELSQAVDMQRRQLMQQLGKDFDASLLDEKLLREAALKGLIDRKLLLQGAENSKFAFSDAALDQVILQTPEFLVDGKFSPERFDQVVRQLGYSRMQFRQMLAQEMLIGQVRAGLAGSGFVTDAQVLAFARLEKQTRDYASLTIKADPAAVKLTDDEVKAYYDEHAKEFMSPDQVVIDYLELKKASFFDQVSVKDEELQALYQKETANLSEQRRAAHILIEVNDKVNEAQAKAKIEEIQARLAKGESFEALAKEFSQDPGSANNGGDLGYAGPGVYDPAFEEALYALNKDQVSAPVRTGFGFHLIKLLGVEAPEVPSFASLKDKLTRELKTQQVEQRFVEATKQLEDSSFEASDLAQPAQELKLTVHTSAPFGREGGEGIAANRAVIQAAFSPEVLDEGANSTAIELDPETVVVLRAKEHRKPEQLPLESVASSIRTQLAKEHASAAAKAKADALIASLREGKTALKAPVDGQNWKVSEAVTRGQEGVEPIVLQALFRMAKPAAKDKPTFSSVTLPNGSLVVLQLNGVNEAAAPTDEEKAQYRRFLASRMGQQDFAAYRKQLENQADIKRF